MEIGFVGTPLIADFYGDSKAEIHCRQQKMEEFLLSMAEQGRVVDGFPISVGE